MNVAGGWFDAGGGYEKFAYTASYADALMLIAARDFPGSYPALQPEAEFGLQWVTKLWNPVLKVLYAQVGIGNGNASNTIQGDYNFWFLPQDEDRMNVSPGGNPGPTAYFVKYRPVFEAAPPGKPVSPNLAGRFAADFALGAQLSAGADPAQAQDLLGLARGVYAMAKTTDVGQLVTAFPHDYYPATQWKSDMAVGRGRDRPGRRGDRRPGRAAERGPGHRGPLGSGVHRPGSPGRRGHIQPLRRRRGGRGRTAAGHASRARGDRTGDRPGHAPGRHGRPAADRRGLG